MKRVVIVLVVALSMLAFSHNVATSGGVTEAISKAIKEGAKKIGKFASKKPVDKKTGTYLIGGAAAADTMNKQGNKK